jgi:ATP synthase protein I
LAAAVTTNGRLRALGRPIRTVLRWQLIATGVLALIAGIAAGFHGALSAALGGAVSIAAGGLAAWVAARGRAPTAGGVLVGALAAEGVKIGSIAILLWLVLAAYGEVVVLAFLGSFLVTVLIFSMAFFVRDRD